MSIVTTKLNKVVLTVRSGCWEWLTKVKFTLLFVITALMG